jgi:hypothetical protein
MGKGDHRKRHQSALDAGIIDAERPTPERMRFGKWNDPKGPGRKHRAIVCTTPDVVGALYEGRLITSAQEQAARHYQETRHRFLGELPDVSGYRSCIDDSVPGYDDGDGNPDVIRAYREITSRLRKAVGEAGAREVLRVCGMDERPTNLTLLRRGLDVLAVSQKRR